MYGKGISKTGEVVDLAVDYNIISKGGSWFSYGTERLAQGRDNVKALLEERPELMEEISNKVIAAIKEERENPSASKKTASPLKKLTPKTMSASLDAEVDD